MNYALANFLALNTPVLQAPDFAKSQNVHTLSFLVGRNEELFVISCRVLIKLILILSMSSFVNR